MRTCPFDNCGQPIPEHIFACRKHWYSISQAGRREIYSAYDDYLENRIGIEELRQRQRKVLDEVQNKPGPIPNRKAETP